MLDDVRRVLRTLSSAERPIDNPLTGARYIARVLPYRSVDNFIAGVVVTFDALHTVRQYSEQGARPDVRVRVHLGGTLRSPTAELSTPDSVRVTNSDLISYLVTGGPSFEIGGRDGDISATAARAGMRV